VLTDKDTDDGSQVGPLLDQIDGPVASFTGDGAFDREDVYAEVTARHPDAVVVVPPRASAVPSATAETTPTTNFAKFPFELGIRLERERLRLERREGWSEADLVIWPATGARLPVEGGAGGSAQQEAFRLGGSGQP
jgi:hypothetical protein